MILDKVNEVLALAIGTVKPLEPTKEETITASSNDQAVINVTNDVIKDERKVSNWSKAKNKMKTLDDLESPVKTKNTHIRKRSRSLQV